MNHFYFALTSVLLLTTNGYAETVCFEAPAGSLVFSDDFDRDEPVPGKEKIGNGWTTNSGWRADGNQQVDLIDGAMHVTRYATADHGVAIFHDLELRDGTVQLRFQLKPGDELSLDFVDRELKTVHAGHLCIARVRLNRLTLADSKTGVMDLKIREQRKAGSLSPPQKTMLAKKTKSFPLSLPESQWHTLEVTVFGDEMAASINGKAIGSLRSEGIAHPTKRMITLGVIKSAVVDDLKAWKVH